VASDLFHLYAQAFPKYGSEKKGLPTNYYLTLAPEAIRLHAELAVVDFVAIQDANAFLSGNPLEGLREEGLIYLQSSLPSTQVWSSLPAAARETIRERRLRLFALDAGRIARESSSRADLQIRMQGIVLLGAFLRLTPFAEQLGLDKEHLFSSLEKTLTKYFGKRGARVIADNLAAARRGYDEVEEIVPLAEDHELKIAKGNGHFTFSCPGKGVVDPNFCDRVIGAYSRGREADLDADEYVARSLMPPSSATERSFRGLAPDIPEFIPNACVGCMECVNECPDTAILAKAVDPAVLEEKLAQVERPELRDALRAQFIKTSKYFEIPQKKGEAGGLFSIFIDPDKCKGCGECVTACGRHVALKMVPKNGNLKQLDLGMDLYRHLPETPKHLLNEKSVGDMMLAGRSLLYAGGAGSCMGCGEATAVRLMLAATGFVYGHEVGVVAATGCNSVYGSTYPFNPFAIPWTNSLFENVAADAMGIRLRWDQEGHTNRRLWCLGGDGAMYDIGFQALSRMLMSGMDIKVLVLDTQVYSNTGGQTSTATFTSQDAKMAAFGKAQHGKSEQRKELSQIAMMHPGVFVAQTTAAHLNHFYKTIMAANEYPGPAVVIAYTTCQPEHGVADDKSLVQAKLAVESRTFPLMVFDPRKGEKIRERLSLAGNPALKEDWYVDPRNNQPVDFISFARTEGRFARHFDAEGSADEYLKKAQQDRLENWHRLQELAGLR
jgi:pyruvate/2-oxoacid:ferredoxin oxidoreductase beta subunit/Pyruvate/2-oxoacid:ferredoxin oxidoreductase gamma subunit/NAD-dependent dihydropyrimidine dehydrogenase PreA subunit